MDNRKKFIRELRRSAGRQGRSDGGREEGAGRTGEGGSDENRELGRDQQIHQSRMRREYFERLLCPNADSGSPGALFQRHRQRQGAHQGSPQSPLDGDRAQFAGKVASLLEPLSCDRAAQLFVESPYAWRLMRERAACTAVVTKFLDLHPDSPQEETTRSLLAAMHRVDDARGLVLSEREREVLPSRDNQRDKQIAAALGLTTHGVRHHLRKLFAKLGVAKRAEAVHRARELGLIADDSRTAHIGKVVRRVDLYLATSGVCVVIRDTNRPYDLPNYRTHD